MNQAKFSLTASLEILENTPAALTALLSGLSATWTTRNEGENTWTVKEVLAHLIICEQTDWMTRVNLILSSNPSKTFAPIDMQAHFELARNKDIKNLLNQYKQEREAGLQTLKALNLPEADFVKTATHPRIGIVKLSELIAAWVAHDMSHLAQIARIIAKQNTELVGSFKEYLRILKV